MLRLLLALRPKTQLTLFGLALVLALPNPITAQLSVAAFTPQEQMNAVTVVVGVGVLGVLVLGVRSRSLRRLKRTVERCS